MSPAATRPHALAITSTLTAASLTTFLGERGKAGDGTPAAAPFVVVHVSPGIVRSRPGSDRGSLGDPNKDVDIAFQTTSVGETEEQALNVHDRVVAALTDATPTVSGRVTVKPIYLDEDPGPVRRDDTAAEPLFYATARWTWRTSA